MTLLTPEQMYRLDKRTMDDFGIPSRVLMETAGKGCADYIKENYASTNEVALVCSSGNNGGDGFVIARWLDKYGFDCTVYLVGTKEKFSAETRANYDLIEKLGLKIHEIDEEDVWKQKRLALLTADIVVDSIFGIGFKGELKGLMKVVVESINRTKGTVISVDIPSGLNALTGNSSLCVKADVTLTMASLKIGHVLGKGRCVCGETEVVPIGIPDSYFGKENPALLIEKENVTLPDRTRHTHKGSYGRVAVIAGSEGYTGAAIMACQSALRSGSGLITLFHRKELSTIFELKLTEVMTKAIPEVDGEPDVYEFISILKNYDVILFGPGIGVSDYTLMILEELLLKIEKPIVIDADGLNLISANPHLLTQIAFKDVLLTPHVGEFSRLAKVSINEIKKNRLEVLKSFTNNYKAKVLLKDSISIYSDMDSTFINTRGNDGLATGGSGDVLSGIITSFIGQKIQLGKAAIAGSYLLGVTAENLNQGKETNAITPTDIIKSLFLK